MANYDEMSNMVNNTTGNANETAQLYGQNEESATSFFDANATSQYKAHIKIIGVGGAGNNIVSHMYEENKESAKEPGAVVEYICVNTDNQALMLSGCQKKIQIGPKLTRGLGAGANSEAGRCAAEESKKELSDAIEGADLLFIVAGMGGGTGTGAAPVIAKIAKEKKILTVAMVTAPFSFEGARRGNNAYQGIEELKKNVDTIIVIPDDRICKMVPPDASLKAAFECADRVLSQPIIGIVNTITRPGLINCDFADVKTILKNGGIAHMGVGGAKGENRIADAISYAINCPLLETTIEGATSVLISIVGKISFGEAFTIGQAIHDVVDTSANIIYGAEDTDEFGDDVIVTVIATGFKEQEKKPPVQEKRIPQPIRPLQSQGKPEPTKAPIVNSQSTQRVGTPVATPTEQKVAQQQATPTTVPVYQQPQAPVAQNKPEEAKNGAPEKKEGNSWFAHAFNNAFRNRGNK